MNDQQQQATVVVGTSIGGLIFASIIDNLIFILMLILAITGGYFVGRYILSNKEDKLKEAKKNLKKEAEKADANQHQEHESTNQKPAQPSDQESKP